MAEELKITTLDEVKTVLERLLSLMEAEEPKVDEEEAEEKEPGEESSEDESEEEETEKCFYCKIYEKGLDTIFDPVTNKRICYLCLSSNI